MIYPATLGELPAMSPPQRLRMWTVASLLFGGAGAALAFSPIGPVSGVVGGIGIAAGTLALLRGGRFWAVSGTVISALAVAVTVLTVLARPLPTPVHTAAAAPVSTNVDAVLADELGVRFGGFTDSRIFPELTVTLTNKLAVVRKCDVAIGAFAGPRQQISSADIAQKSSRYGGIVLDAHATVEATAEFLMGSGDEANAKLGSATFRVISVACGPFDDEAG